MSVTIRGSLSMPDLINHDLAQYVRRVAGLGWRVIAPRTKQLLAMLDEAAQLLRSPGVPAQMHRASTVAIAISKGVPSGMIGGLALQLVAAIGVVGQFPEVPAHMVALDTLLRRLREALQATQQIEGE